MAFGIVSFCGRFWEAGDLPTGEKKAPRAFFCILSVCLSGVSLAALVGVLFSSAAFILPWGSLAVQFCV